MYSLARVAGVDSHAQDEVHARRLRRDVLGIGLGIERDSNTQAELACVRDQRRRVVDDLVMEGDVVRPCFLEGLEVVLGVVHHEMDVEDAAALAKERRDRLGHDRADRDRLDEVPVADVELEDLRAALEQGHHVVAQSREIRRVDRRLDLGPAHPLVPAHRRGSYGANRTLMGRHYIRVR